MGGYDQIQFSGTLALGGTLQVSLINGFTPAAGESFNLFDWTSVNGTFATLALPTLGSGLAWNTAQLYTTGVLSVVGAGLAGDYNNNGVVDVADYVLWRSGGPLANEVDTPNTVNAQDYTEWRNRFGNISGSGSLITGSPVPEPAIGGLMLILCVTIGVFNRLATLRKTWVMESGQE